MHSLLTKTTTTTTTIGQNFLQEFPRLVEDFQRILFDIDRRMAAIILRGFDDCTTLESVFKVRPLAIDSDL
jgi:hypothetical protein